MEYTKIKSYIADFANKLNKTQKMVLFFLILAILGLGAYLINPPKKLLEMRNSQRRSDVVTILNAAYQYASDNDGKLLDGINANPTYICRSKAVSCQGMVDFSQVVSNKKYLLSEIPVDPKEKSANSSGYQISKLANGRINVTAPNAENKATISLSK